MDHAKVLYDTYRTAESEWINSQSKKTDSRDTTSQISSELQECSLHYGELAFLLSGLKPCVLIQMPTPDLTRSLYHQVLQSQWMQLDSFKEQHRLGLNCQLITKQVRSPEMLLMDCVLVWSTRVIQSHQQSERIQHGVDLLFSTKDSKSQIIPEDDLAVMLDLPGRLPQSEAEVHRMIEVSYWHQGNVTTVSGQNKTPASDESPTLLTAFAAQPDQIPNIQTHFKRYRDAVRDKFGIQLKLHIQSMADS
ncbi:hypothetical protein BGZ76_003918 [Entomortierella beljakovae]|nr:hypothetical protein BGZ76_003918 [Entomortierella beljakovae]